MNSEWRKTSKKQHPKKFPLKKPDCQFWGSNFGTFGTCLGLNWLRTPPNVVSIARLRSENALKSLWARKSIAWISRHRRSFDPTPENPRLGLDVRIYYEEKFSFLGSNLIIIRLHSWKYAFSEFPVILGVKKAVLPILEGQILINQPGKEFRSCQSIRFVPKPPFLHSQVIPATPACVTSRPRKLSILIVRSCSSIITRTAPTF